jgi:hypothetical protein
MTPDAVIDMSAQDWNSDRAAQKPYVENILYRRRGWSWITEGDARTLVGLSKVKSIYQQELTPDLVKRTLAKAAPARTRSLRPHRQVSRHRSLHRHESRRQPRAAGVGDGEVEDVLANPQPRGTRRGGASS